MTTLAHRWLPSLALLAWAGVLLIFAWTGRINSLLVPAFRPWVVVAGLILAVMALITILAAKHLPAHEHDHDHSGDGDCGHTIIGSLFGKLLTFTILIVPILAAATFAPESFSARTVRNRGLISDAASFGTAPATSLPAAALFQEPPLPSKTGSPAPAAEPETGPDSVIAYMEKTPEGYPIAEVIDFIFAADEPDLRQGLEGQTIAVVGQLMEETESNTTGQRFQIMRMFMNCCAADARPVGVTVQAGQLPEIPEMSWIRVIAKTTFPIEGGKPKPVLEAIEIKKIDPPQETMLF